MTLLFALIALPLLAGCLAGGEDPLPYDSYEAARAGEGPELAPDEETTLRLKLLEPSQPQEVSTGERQVFVLVYDEATDAPVTGADFGNEQQGCGSSHGFCAEMPEMGHGTSPEEPPVHRDHGIYQGMTTISMPGNWTLHFRPQIDGHVVEFTADLNAHD